MDFVSETSFEFVLPFTEWIFYAIAIFLLSAGLGLTWWGTRGLLLYKRLGIVALRTGALLLLLFIWAQPSLLTRKDYQVKEGLVFILDGSKSMATDDTESRMSRASNMKDDWLRIWPGIKRLSERFDVSIYALETDGLKKLEDEEVPKPEGEKSDYYDAVQKVISKHRKGLRQVVILGDGRLTTDSGYGPLSELANRQKILVSAAGYGDDSETAPDAALGQIDVPHQVVRRNNVTISSLLTTKRMIGRIAEITLKINGKPYRTKKLIIGSDDYSERVEFEYTPLKVGFYRVEMEIEPLKKERNLADNYTSDQFRAIDTKEKILFLDGQLRWEHRYIKRALASLEQFSLTTVTAYQNPRELRRVLPTDEKEWRKYKLLILGDVASKSFTDSQMKSMRDFVSDGGGIIFLGGLTNNGRNGFYKTPLEPVVPVSLTALDIQVDKPFLMEVSPEQEKNHSVLKWAGKRELYAWKEMPELEGMIGVGKLKPAATLLMSGAGYPLLAVQEYGRGRSAFFAADTTYKWILQLDKGSEFHKLFWRHLALWTAKGAGQKERFSLRGKSDKSFYRRSDVIELSAVFSPEEITSDEEKADIYADIVEKGSPSKKKTVRLGTGPGEHNIPMEELDPGEYTVTYRLDMEGQKPVTDTSSFVVSSISREMEVSTADLKGLEALAVSAKGKFYRSSDIDNLVGDLSALSRPDPVLREEAVPLWNDPLVLLTFLGLSILLFSMEWYIRRKHRLP